MSPKQPRDFNEQPSTLPTDREKRPRWKWTIGAIVALAIIVALAVYSD